MRFSQVRMLVDIEAARLRDAIVQEPVDQPEWGGRVAYLRDPDGSLIELFQSIPTSNA